MKLAKNLGVMTLCATLAACNTLDRIADVGKGPALDAEKSPLQQDGYKPITNWPTPVEPGNQQHGANSLWQPGARSFFKDQRATRVGDILTVVVNITDNAKLANSTARNRTTAENLATPEIFGLQNRIYNAIPGDQNKADLLDLSGATASTGDGQINRQETIATKIAASITQVLPNGNLALKGTQQVRVNYEMREITVEGVIRPEDISSDNTISSDQIAEARISYGGKGVVSDFQQPRYGDQLIDILSPF